LAKHTTLSCDKCGKAQAARVDIHEVQIRLPDKSKFEVDLCGKCWGSMVKDYAIRETQSRKRNSFTVVDLDSLG
jgi:hypothetical protein